jgi:hypothetical protein
MGGMLQDLAIAEEILESRGFPNALTLAHAAGHAVRSCRWSRGSPVPIREACISLPGLRAGCSAERAASITTPMSDRRSFGCPPLVRWVCYDILGSRQRQVRGG